MFSLLKVAVIVGVHGAALAFVPPVRLFVAAVGTICPVDEDLPTYVDED